MVLPLTDAALRGGVRALRRRTHAHTILFGLLTATLVGAPLAGVAIGRSLGGFLGPALADVEVARALVLGLVFTLAGGGVALGVAVPPLAALGDQLAAAPARAIDRAAAILVFPMVGVLLVAATVGAPIVIGVLAAAPGGVATFPATAALGFAAVVAGAALGAGLRHAGAGRMRWAWAAAAALAIVSLSSPSGDLAGAIAARAAAAHAVPEAVVTALLCLVAWGTVVVAVSREPGSPVRPTRLPTRPAPATAVVVGRLLVRRAETRSSAVAAVGFGGCGLAVAWLAAAPPPSATLLATTGAVASVLPIGLALGGMLAQGAHVWALAARRAVITLGWLVAGSGTTLASVAVVLVAALGVDRSGTGAAVALALASCGVVAAIVAGTVIPWKRTGIAEQAASLGVCALACGAVAILAAVIGPRAEAEGIPGVVTVSVLVGCGLGAAWRGLAQTLAAEG